VQSLFAGLSVLSLAAFTLPWSAGSGGTAPTEKTRTLIITGGHDYEQKQFYAMFDAMEDVAYEKAVFPAAIDLLEPTLKKRFDAIVLYDMWAKGFAPKEQEAFVDLLESGIGVVALHHTLAAHQAWPEYKKIIGGKYRIADRTVNGKTVPKSTYHHDQDIDVTVADREHPITRGLSSFRIHDETYHDFEVEPTVKVLLKTDHPRSTPQIAWAKTYAKSRVVYIQLGHDHHAYEHPTYRTIVARAIRWAAGNDSESGTR
jgi:type 1 glutamine amidotransferase